MGTRTEMSGCGSIYDKLYFSGGSRGGAQEGQLSLSQGLENRPPLPPPPPPPYLNVWIGRCIVVRNLVTVGSGRKKVVSIRPYLGLQSRILTKQLSAWINKFYGCFDL